MKLRYGILSTANVAPRVIDAIRQEGTGEVIAIASREISKAIQFAEEHRIHKAYGSYEELFLDSDVDIVYIPTVNQAHFQNAKDALEHGKHVLVEKPFTLKLSESEKLFQLAKEKKRFIMEGQKSLFLPLTHEIRDMIQLGAIGDIIYIDSITAYPNIGHVTWFEDAEMGGGTLHLMGAYPFEYLPYLIGSEIVDCSGVARMFEGGTDSQSNFSIKFANGALANIFLTTHIDLPKELTIYGTKGKIVIPRFWGAQTASVEARACSAFEVTHKMDNEFIYEIKHVNECIREGKLQSDVMTEENTLTTIRIMEEFYKKW